MRLRQILTVACATGVTTAALAGFAGAASAACVPSSSGPVFVCASADPHIEDSDPSKPGAEVSTAESVTVAVFGPLAVCVGRVVVGAQVGGSVTLQGGEPDYVYQCY